MDINPQKRFLRLPEVERRTGLRHTQIHKLEVQGRFPRRVKISVRAAGWLEHEIEAWIDGKVEASRHVTPISKSVLSHGRNGRKSVDDGNPVALT